ncbi:unnamed protein product [Linum tenue]|uniref:Uncharacterized protein n=1 Tax=Linum tenue TaxID=586396 RepID=A0AAV0HZH2_9ROSI|nr:unnamed protein product [Linum tenue]
MHTILLLPFLSPPPPGLPKDNVVDELLVSSVATVTTMEIGLGEVDARATKAVEVLVVVTH